MNTGTEPKKISLQEKLDNLQKAHDFHLKKTKDQHVEICELIEKNKAHTQEMASRDATFENIENKREELIRDLQAKNKENNELRTQLEEANKHISGRIVLLTRLAEEKNILVKENVGLKNGRRENEDIFHRVNEQVSAGVRKAVKDTYEDIIKVLLAKLEVKSK